MLSAATKKAFLPVKNGKYAFEAHHNQKEIDMHQLREKIAYSKLGKFVATIVRNKFYPEARVHWVQQAFADGRFYK